MILNKLFQQHPEYNRILGDIKKSSVASAMFVATEISGVPFTLQDSLIRLLNSESGKAISYVSRDSFEIRKFIKTLQIIEFKEHPLRKILNILNNHNFKRALKVSTLGEYALTGDTLSLWPAGLEHPIRASYFGDSFETASYYDEIYGKKYEHCDRFIIGDLSAVESNVTLNNYFIPTGNQKYLNRVLIFGGDNLDTFDSENQYGFDFNYPQIYFQRFDILTSDLALKTEQGYNCEIFSAHQDVFPKELHKYFASSDYPLEAGIESKALRRLILTDRELFGTIFLNKVTKRLTTDKARKMLAELEGEIEIDDYIVHEDYGIGIYKGIKQEKYEQKIPLDFGKFKTNVLFEDYILIRYAEEDELYVPLSQINKITKYIGTEGGSPELTRLGKTEWATIKRKARADIEKMAKELVAIYAKRAISNAPAIQIQDQDEYDAFVAQFPYPETKDQKRAEMDILADLMQNKPMNRLIVGDVGFGKTEVAIRAAYLLAAAGFQVAVLCPTTVLAAQHEKVFADRFKNTSFSIACMSRLNTHENKATVEKLAQGKVDIVIGTHRLLSQDIAFKKLGLVIIDEEQKFGVKQKEKLKKLEAGAHVLAMSATPIPRTLSMALSAIQEISLIQTPPANRKVIATKVERFDWQKVIAAITYEVERKGQVYFLHNSVDTILSTLAKLQKFLPGVRFAVAHGQMNPMDLAKTMNHFYDKEVDCLICTTIIENGIDMPNVNTIIIEHAQNFGLGQLYQLRGRVGRSDTQAYAYMLYEGSGIDEKETDEKELNPDLKRKKKKEQDYKKRLKAVLESQDLGSGFRLASRDLEIRGAGNLLGREQHGNIKYMGYGLYMQLLAEEIEKLKNEVQN